MNGQEFQNWCSQSDGKQKGHGNGMSCELDDKVVHFEGDDMIVESKDSSIVPKIEGPADEFFNMGRAQLAIEAGDVSLQFQK